MKRFIFSVLIALSLVSMARAGWIDVGQVQELKDHFRIRIQQNAGLRSYASKPRLAVKDGRFAKGTESMIVRNSLFWIYSGKDTKRIKWMLRGGGTTYASWLLCGDGVTKAQRTAYIQWCKKYNLNTILLCLNNEGYMSLFKPKKYMQEWDDARIDVTASFIQECKANGLLVAIVFWDHPEDKRGRYYPILSKPDEVHAQFVEIVCNALNPYVDLYLIGCESNRYRSEAWVEAAIAFTQQHSSGILVGTHEQNAGWRNNSLVMTRRVSNNANFWCYETSNHPAKGDEVSVPNMLAEVRFVTSHAHGVPMWVGEHNLNILGKRSIEQAQGISTLDDVYGVDGPM